MSRLDAEFETRLAALAATPGTLVSGSSPDPTSLDQLDRAGFHVFESRLSSKSLDSLRALFESAQSDSGDPHESGTRHIPRFAECGASVVELATAPLVLQGVLHVMKRAFRITAIGGRDPRPGFGLQGLHADWGPRYDAREVEAVTAIWLLDCFADDNGATRVVSGTHQLKRAPPKSLARPGAHHPDESRIVAPAGSLLLFNGHLWHGGTRNDSTSMRRVVQCNYVARQYRYMAMAAPSTASEKARFLFED